MRKKKKLKTTLIPLIISILIQTTSPLPWRETTRISVHTTMETTIGANMFADLTAVGPTDHTAEDGLVDQGGLCSGFEQTKIKIETFFHNKDIYYSLTFVLLCRNN